MLPLMLAGVSGAIIVRAIRGAHFSRAVNGNERILTRDEKKTARRLLRSHESKHLLRGWPRPGVNDQAKHSLLRHVAAGASASDATTESLRMQVLQPPRAEKQPKVLEAEFKEGLKDTRTDEFYWMRDDERKNPAVLAHLEAEKAYCDAVMSDTKDLQATLFGELKGRIQEADETAAQRHGAYFYYTRTEEGQQYKVHCRRKIPAPLVHREPREDDAYDPSVPEEVLLDENLESKRFSFYSTGSVTVSPDHRLLAYCVDVVGGEKYNLHVRDLATGKELLPQPIEGTAGDVEWANDSQTLFYVTKDELDRPFKVWRYVLGQPLSSVVEVYHERDDAFYIGLSRSRSDAFLTISAGSAITSETLVLRADDPTGSFVPLLPRQHGADYSVRHRGDFFYVLFRDDARPNSELLAVRAPGKGPVGEPQVLLPHRPDVKLDSFTVSKNYLGIIERKDGLQRATVVALEKDGCAMLGPGREITFEEPCWELELGEQGPFDSPLLRLRYSSLATPTTIIDYNMATHQRKVKKVQPVLGGFDAARLKTQRLWATAQDGTRVPISVVYRSDLVTPGAQPVPLHLYAYGSYEISIDPGFRSDIHSLLDRGWIYAIAHVRGGGEMGRMWYEDGKFEKKVNTFTDFIACAKHLLGLGYSQPSMLTISGRSAGGLTMGAVINMAPELFQGVILGVPFVDCLTTMRDPSIPLTVIEWEEWGSPVESPEIYRAMKAYSPYDNIARTRYPHALFTGGLHDPRVGYWEPAKACARLRDMRADKGINIFNITMGAGHFSYSGRFDRLKETAFEYAFLLKAVELGRKGL